MSDRQSSSAAESTGFGWFIVALAGVVGIATGLVLGFVLSPSAGSSIAELTNQRDRLAAENTALTAEHEQAKLQAHNEKGSKPNDPQGSDWKAWLEIEKAYGPSSTFGRFAQRLEATKWWTPGAYWSIRGNLQPGISPEAIGLQLYEPVAGSFVGCLSVSFPDSTMTPKEEVGFSKVAKLELNLEKVFFMGDKYSILLQGACEAIGQAMEFDAQEIQRVRKVAGLIPRVPPREAANGMTAVAIRIPLSHRNEFSKKLDVLAEQRQSGKAGDNSQPAINFALSKRYVASIRFGDYSGEKIPSVWLITITANTDFSRDPAWTQVDETEVDSMNNDQ